MPKVPSMSPRILTLALLTATLVACDNKGDDDTGATGGTDADSDGVTTEDGDCDDNNDAVFPGADEVCDGVDNDCDNLVDDDDDDVDTSTGGTFYADADADGFGAEGSAATEACEAGEGWAETADDCDDANAEIHPAATEVCDEDDTDENCNGTADDDDDTVDPDSGAIYFTDADGDTYGDVDDPGIWACEEPPSSEGGYVTDATDCDDSDDAVHPAATEVCDEDDTDEDCNGTADDADAGVDLADGTLWYTDVDQDTYGADDDAGTVYCDDPSDSTTWYSADNTDCEDADDSANPGLTEVCNDGLDNDCDGTANECTNAGVLSATDSDVIWTGEALYSGLGRGLGSAGDVNGDGFDDILLGSPNYDADAGSDTYHGRAYLVWGSTTLSSGTADAAAAVTFTSDTDREYVGYNIDGAGDVDGDGYDDFVIGAIGVADAGTNAGAAFLYYGAASGWSGDWEPSTTADATFTGETAVDYLGHGVNAAGDLDGDGYDDFVMGAIGTDTAAGTSLGDVYVAYGSATRYAGAASASTLPSFQGVATNDWMGSSRSMDAADLNGDGYDDLAMGVQRYDTDADSGVGAVAVQLGGASRWTGVTAATDTDGFISGTSTDDESMFGDAVSSAGDVNNDGYEDLVVGAQFYDAGGYDAGAAYVFFGSTSAWERTRTTLTADWSMTGVDTFDNLGYDVVGLNDFDGDGTDDFAVGCPDCDDTPNDEVGAVFVFYGDASIGGAVTEADADTTVMGDAGGVLYGGTLADGDVNGDGVGDLLGGAVYGDAYFGSVNVLYGLSL
jgi:hypothetical protein